MFLPLYRENIKEIKGKGLKNEHFNVLNPLNGVFGANLVSYPQGGVTEDFLGQFWKIKNVVTRKGDSIKTSKMAIFGHFEGQNTISCP